jgi:DNA (cytosine-5)-methyltransferase 1
MKCKYISLFSGISSESVAWRSLGWELLALSEIDPHANAVLSHRHPNTPNLGDIKDIDWSPYTGEVDLVIGGAPCTSFSFAGLRKGLEDPRGNLTYEYIRAINEIKPRFSLFENVPGMLSDKTNAFGCLLSGLLGESEPLKPPDGKRWNNNGFLLGSEASIAWRVFDSKYFGVPQARRRVFVFGYYFGEGRGLCTENWGDGRRFSGIPAAVLFEPESQSGNSQSSPEAREETTQTPRESSPEQVYRIGAFNSEGMRSSNPNSGIKAVSQTASLQSNGNDPSCNQGGNAIVFPTYCVKGAAIGRKPENGPQRGEIKENQSYTLNTAETHAVCSFTSQDYGQDVSAIAPTLRAGSYNKSRPNAGAVPSVLFDDLEIRKLTPVECERLQGLPDDWSNVPYKKKGMPRGARYRLIGNSITSNILEWIGKRIDFVASQI